MKRTLEERFWAKVDKSGDCWLWTGGVKGAGKGGAFWVGRHASGESRYEAAHRVSWALATGENLATETHLYHSCGNVMCVRPDHLYVPHEAACTCGECRTYRNQRAAERRQAWRAEHPLPPRQVDSHGTSSRYVRRGCRCDECVEAFRAKNRRLYQERRRRLDEMADQLPHGNTSTYINWGCRCVPCTTAQSAANREYQVRRAERLRETGS